MENLVMERAKLMGSTAPRRGSDPTKPDLKPTYRFASIEDIADSWSSRSLLFSQRGEQRVKVRRETGKSFVITIKPLIKRTSSET